MITEEWWCHHFEEGKALRRGPCTSGTSLGAHGDQRLERDCFEGFFYLELVVGGVLENGSGRENNLSSGRMLLSRKLVRNHVIW